MLHLDGSKHRWLPGSGYQDLILRFDDADSEVYQSVVKVPRAPRPFLRPPDKARFGSIPGVCDRIATQSAGMQGRSDAVATFATGCYYAQLVAEESTKTVMAAIREVVGQQGVFNSLYTDAASHFVHTPVAGYPPDREHLLGPGWRGRWSGWRSS